jgi:hypothetical protein
VLQEAARSVPTDCSFGKSKHASLEAVGDAVWDIAQEQAQKRRGSLIPSGPVTIIRPDEEWWEAYKQAREAASGGMNTPRREAIRVSEIALALTRAHENGLGFYFPIPGRVILVPAPEISADNQGRLHSLEGPAINWQGGNKFYLIHGVRFDKYLWQKLATRAIPVRKILEISNFEQRRAALTVYGIEDIAKMATASVALLDSYLGSAGKQAPQTVDKEVSNAAVKLLGWMREKLTAPAKQALIELEQKPHSRRNRDELRTQLVISLKDRHDLVSQLREFIPANQRVLPSGLGILLH